MRIYADTSVFGGMFDKEFSKPSKQFFDEVESGRFILVTSAVVEAEIEPAPDNIRQLFNKYADFAEITDISEEALELQLSYIKSGVVTEKSLDDIIQNYKPVSIADLKGKNLLKMIKTEFENQESSFEDVSSLIVEYIAENEDMEPLKKRVANVFK